ncbi:MAG: hypothetical protein SFY69_08620 [Planctomycetota bacterium]|nr:hypothetical protein [Planctomycetota bacterium]
MAGDAVSTFVYGGLPAALPPGYAAAPILPTETGVVRLCVVLRGGNAAKLVHLRDTVDARVWLGCLADAGGRVHEWLELWVQDLSGIAQAPAIYREGLSNAALDARWVARFAEAEKLDQAPHALGASCVLRTGLEREHPAPILIDPRALRAIEPKDRRTGATWTLCTDDGLLTRRGAAPYGTTLARHLYQPELGDEATPLPVEDATPAAMGIPEPALALNLGGGLMRVERYCPLSYEQYVDALTGLDAGEGEGDPLLESIAATASGEQFVPGAGWLMLSASAAGQSPAARLVEALHLKLMALGGAVSAVRAAIASGQAPMLNVSASSFRVTLSGGGAAAPLWWSARVALVEPGEGLELTIPGTDVRYYVGGRGGAVSIYAPSGMAQGGGGRGRLRLRNVVSDDASGIILEATLSTQDRVMPGPSDLLWLRFSVGGERLDQYATIDSRGTMSPGEVRVRTIPRRMPADVAARLKGALGVPIQDVTFEILPMLSSPCDLYAVGVLATRTLLTGKGVSLPVAMDELLSLAGRVAQEASSGEELVSRLERAFAAEPRWAESLGPHMLAATGLRAAEASAVIPPRLWMGVIAMAIRCFTGLGPDARCRDFGDAPPGGLHRVFDGLMDDLYALLAGCRTLIVADHRLNSEIRAIVRECMVAAR